MKTGNTGSHGSEGNLLFAASMEPGHEDREYWFANKLCTKEGWASMEPGHEDREYSMKTYCSTQYEMPQWSPVMKTGNTPAFLDLALQPDHASMEPGHEDREYHVVPHVKEPT